MTEIRDRVYLNNGYFPIAFFSESVNSRFIVENADYLIGANRSYPIQNRYKWEFSYLSKNCVFRKRYYGSLDLERY